MAVTAWSRVRLGWRWSLVVVAGFLLLSVRSGQAATGNVSISAAVIGSSQPPAQPIVRFTGFAAPYGTAKIYRSDTLIATATLGGNSQFDITTDNQPVGQQTYTVRAWDFYSQELSPVTFVVNMTLGTTTVITGVFLGPSIALDKASVKVGQPVTFSGATAPASAVTLTINSAQAGSYNVTADSNGRWSKIVSTQALSVGTYTGQAQSVLNGNQLSALSAVVSFAVNPLEQCDGKMTADLNCDGLVDLVDFSILLYFWQQTTPSNSRTDINSDSRVDVVDFSIMLYQWNG
jgi:hypothetical protein